MEITMTPMKTNQINSLLLLLWKVLAVSLLLSACQSLPTGIAAADQQKIDRLLTLMDQRLNVAVMVAQSKWNSGAPINDPVREQKILDDLSASLTSASEDEKAFMRRFFQAQFDAGKLIQLDLHAQWRREKRERFIAPPDLARDIRPELDRLTPLLIDTLNQTLPSLKQAAARHYLQQRSEVLLRGDVNGTARREAVRVLLEIR
ncbi:gamma subclass chorismate mutase AroQ [Herbaspirillum sp. meg3]|jgi:chorismate mutase|uniref:gamma subclass chorismate mutase AroQ n=1 Tax=Herbaspirillum sp. meg3 TaxID=2025949 RepID=UPI001E3F275C|nr:gamma subclass chorismate mutase AroQ [Herbaspirillum sp. meg3]